MTSWMSAVCGVSKTIWLGKMTLGPYHPYSVTALSDFAFTLHCSNRLEQVESLRREVAIRREKILDADDGGTFRAKEHLLLALDDQPQEKFDIWSEIISSRLPSKGKNHDHALTAIQNLGIALFPLVSGSIHTRLAGRNRAATDKERESMQRGLLMLDTHLKLVRDALRDNHICTFAIMTLLASELYRAFLGEEAELILRHVVQWRSQMFEDDIAQTCRHVARLAPTLCRRRRYAEAKELISDVIKLRAS